MGKITFILGGARSGKSTHALDLAKKRAGKTVFIATCQALDKEMEQRIELHKKARPAAWQTFEAPYDISKVLKKIGDKCDCIIIDCLTLLVSNLMLAKNKFDAIEANINKVISYLQKTKSTSIIVSNEVGLGIVPANRLARNFRDIAGSVNRIVASQADEVLFMVSGIPVIIKSKSKSAKFKAQNSCLPVGRQNKKLEF